MGTSGPSAVFILDSKGKILISRNYRGDVPMSAAERFISKLTEDEDLNIKPVLEEDGITYVYIKTCGLYLLATTMRNANAAMILMFLYRLVDVFKEYFTVVEEESITDNFVIIYELLDEVMDFGVPQTTEPKVLQEYITQESFRLEKDVRPSAAVTNAVSWRPEGIFHKKNEVYLDVIESVNLMVNTNGNVLHSEIIGCIHMDCKLSGMPDLRLGLNDRVQFESGGGAGGDPRNRAIEMEDVNFHQCVRLSRFEHDRTISFIPPDGEFDLMTYRLNTQLKPLIKIDAIIDRHLNSRVAYRITARSQFKQRSVANNVQIRIPVPQDVDSPAFKATFGKVKYIPEDNCLLWTIKQFQGGREHVMRAQFGLPSIHEEESEEDRPPIKVSFDIPYFTVSGIQVRYLKIVERSNYQALPWVRYITKSGDYQIRI